MLEGINRLRNPGRYDRARCTISARPTDKSHEITRQNKMRFLGEIMKERLAQRKKGQDPHR